MPAPVAIKAVEGKDDAATIVVEQDPTLISTDVSNATLHDTTMEQSYLSPPKGGRDDDTMTTAISAASMCSCGERFDEELDTLARERDAALERVNVLEEQLDAMISATTALARLMKEKPVEMKSGLTNTSGINVSQSPFGLVDDDVILDRLIKLWRLEDTGFVSLFSSFKAMQSNLRLTHAEADAAVEELTNVKMEAAEAKSNLSVASKALKQLWKENASLKLERKKLARDIKAYVNKTEEEKQSEINRAVSFITHEHSLSSVSLDRSNVFDDEMSLSSRSLLIASSPSSCSEGGAAASTILIQDEAVPL